MSARVDSTQSRRVPALRVKVSPALKTRVEAASAKAHYSVSRWLIEVYRAGATQRAAPSLPQFVQQLRHEQDASRDVLFAYVSSEERTHIVAAMDQRRYAGRIGEWQILQILAALATAESPTALVPARDGAQRGSQRSPPMSSPITKSSPVQLAVKPPADFASMILAIINRKGGAGKTTGAIFAAVKMEEQLRSLFGPPPAGQGSWTLLIDWDSQGSSSAWAQVEMPEDEQAALTLAQRADYYLRATGKAVRDRLLPFAGTPTIVHSDALGIDVIPASMDLGGLELKLSGEVKAPFVLRQLIQPLRHLYRVIVIDTLSAAGLLVANAMTAADEILIPIEPHYLSLNALTKMLNDVLAIIGDEAMGDPSVNPSLRVAGIIANKFQATHHHKDRINELVAFFAQQGSPLDNIPLLGVISTTVEVSEASLQGTLGRGRALNVQQVYGAIVSQLLIRWGWMDGQQLGCYQRTALAGYLTTLASEERIAFLATLAPEGARVHGGIYAAG